MSLCRKIEKREKRGERRGGKKGIMCVLVCVCECAYVYDYVYILYICMHIYMMTIVQKSSSYYVDLYRSAPSINLLLQSHGAFI